jgi:predicted nucleic acid-binding protein
MGSRPARPDEAVVYGARRNADVQPEWERLVIQHNVAGKKVHDARLVALMKVHNVSRILTFNGDDFVRYPGVITISPETVASAEKPPARP